MTTDGPELLGFVAATLTTLAFLPQVLRTWRTRSARDFSPLWIAFFGLGLACWLGYGALIGSLSLIGANGLTLALVLSIAWVKWRESGVE
jgi:MtN3 and saliva related transmembrane protein